MVTGKTKNEKMRIGYECARREGSEIGVRDEKKERWRYGYVENGRIIRDSLGHT
jgi:YD repeat-containing protein